MVPKDGLLSYDLMVRKGDNISGIRIVTPVQFAGILLSRRHFLKSRLLLWSGKIYATASSRAVFLTWDIFLKSGFKIFASVKESKGYFFSVGHSHFMLTLHCRKLLQQVGDNEEAFCRLKFGGERHSHN